MVPIIDKIKTSIVVRAVLWREFMSYVVKQRGYKSLSSELEVAIKEYLEKRNVDVPD